MVSHSRLFYKLQHYGIIKDYLSNRVQNVVQDIDDASGTSLQVISGIYLRGQSWDLCFSCFT